MFEFSIIRIFESETLFFTTFLPKTFFFNFSIFRFRQMHHRMTLEELCIAKIVENKEFSKWYVSTFRKECGE